MAHFFVQPFTAFRHTLGEHSRGWLRRLVGLIVRHAYRLDVREVAEVPQTGATLVVCNHVSFVDAFLLAAAVPRPMRFVMANSYFEHPLLRPLFRWVRAIPVASSRDRPEVVEAAFASVSEAFAAGEVVCIFPEGCITRDGAMNRFRRGVERILADHPVPVVPMAIVGQWGSRFSRAGRAARRGRASRAPVAVVVGRRRVDQPSAQSLQEDVAGLIAAYRRAEWGHEVAAS